MNNVGVGHSHSQDGGDQLHVLVHGLGGPAGVGDQGEYGAHGDDGGLRDAGPGIVYLSVFFGLVSVTNLFSFSNITKFQAVGVEDMA